MFKSILTVGAFIGAVGTALPVMAASCAPRDIVVERLAQKYGESLTGGGLQSQAQVIEVWSAPETGTWTVLLTQANGTTCVMASGTNWQQNAPMTPAKGTAS